MAGRAEGGGVDVFFEDAGLFEERFVPGCEVEGEAVIVSYEGFWFRYADGEFFAYFVAAGADVGAYHCDDVFWF